MFAFAPKPAARWIGLYVSALLSLTAACTTEIIVRSKCDDEPHRKECRDRDSDPGPVRDAGPAPDGGPGWSEPDASSPPCICPDIYEPVCGRDGWTYSNRCEAACANVPIVHPGECATPDAGFLACRNDRDCPPPATCDRNTFTCVSQDVSCLCDAVYDPVCGVDGRTYENSCTAQCRGVRVAYPGACTGCNGDDDCPHGFCEHFATCAGLNCPPPPPSRCFSCGDGSALTCRMAAQPCPRGQVREIVNGCYGECVDRYSCLRPEDKCDYDAPGRTWVSRDARACQRIDFDCKEGQPFSNECGCGCEAVPTCRIGGCSGQLCVGPGDPDISTCEFRPEYACYREHATCEVQASGRCGWTPSEALRKCIADARAGVVNPTIQDAGL